MSKSELLMAADAVLYLHFAFVLFVVVGLLLIVLGGLCGWLWTRAPWFRGLHLLAISVVVAESLLGVVCPLTGLEDTLRAAAGASVEDASFIARWVSELMFYQAPEWVFTLVYCLFASAVVLTWWRWPPRRAHSQRHN